MWFIFDAMGIALSAATWACQAFADYVVTVHVFVPWFWTATPTVSWLPFTDMGLVLFIGYQTLMWLSWFSHLQALSTDPGTINQKVCPPVGLSKPVFCKLCGGRWKPPRAHHCKLCRRCIFRMDHHCPWINNCVGLANQKLFMLFLGYTALCSVVTIVLIVGSAVVSVWKMKSWEEAEFTQTNTLLSSLVTLECMAAILFVVDFLKEQIESIQTNQTLVETYQGTHGTITTFDEHFRAVFGDRWWKWPLPFCTAPLPDYSDPAVPDLSPWQTSSDVSSLGIAGQETEVNREVVARHVGEGYMTEVPDSANTAVGDGLRSRTPNDREDY